MKKNNCISLSMLTTGFLSLGLWMTVGIFVAGANSVTQTEGETPYKIDSRLELFIDDFMIESLTGDASRRMHRPEHREVVHALEKPWEGKTSGYLAVVQDGELVRIYYNASPRFRRQTPAVIESNDGINFRRPKLGIVEFEGSTDNNLLPQFGTAGHHFTPFIDTNPESAPDARYKAFARGPGGMRFYASPDGIDWRMLEENPNITHGDEDTKPASDTQNLAFWDPVRERYVAYLRLFRPHRCIRYATSPDLVNWTATLPVEYDDDRKEHLYTNGIRPYDRAPHIFIGLPNRYVTGRKKIAAHPNSGINDVVLMSSRDGVRFQRWPESFIRPGPDPEVWTDRNHYPAWGLVRTSPTELSLYWTEHYRHAGMRFRRGTIRVDGFASVHAGSAGGELLTRPLIFSGDRLVVNYQTSAAGAMRFELADAAGDPVPGFTLADSETLFGNAIEHLVSWRDGADLSTLAGRPVRLRVQLRDADLYAIRFEPAEEIRARLAAAADEARAVLADPLPEFATRFQDALRSALEQYEIRLDHDRELERQATLESDFLIRRALHGYK
ncbi:MAG: hypothetical protein LC725_12335, partial [Lentisphaerae bacterium]|nr:hypothetical protein [Lentisphaerota bacterium]